MKVYKNKIRNYFFIITAVIIINGCTGISIFEPISIKLAPHNSDVPVIIQLNIIEGRTDRIDGINIGLYNFVGKKIRGLQVGLHNNCEKVDGNIFEGVVSRSSECEVIGVQIGISNLSLKNTNGIQVGIMNMSKGDMVGAQFGLINMNNSDYYSGSFIFQGGLLNVCINNDFFKFTPIMNICSK